MEQALLHEFDATKWIQSHPPPSCSPQYSQPTVTGSGKGWTITDSTNCTHNDISGLCPINLPKTFPVDLNDWKGDRYRPKPDSHAGVEILIKELATSATHKINDVDVITFRNNLNKILGTVIDPKSPWYVDACFLNGTLFLDIVKKKSEEMSAFEATPEAAKFDFWGRAFEAACLGEHIADATKEYGVLVRARLDGLRLFIGAEIDGYEPYNISNVDNGESIQQQEIPSLNSFVEFKTYLPPIHPGQNRSLNRFKHAKWWLQSYLAGVQKILLGARDDHGLIHQIHTIQTKDLPRISRHNGADWDPNQILAFGSSCLQWMFATCKAHSGEHLRFMYDGGVTNKVTWSVVDQGELSDRIKKCLSPD